MNSRSINKRISGALSLMMAFSITAFPLATQAASTDAKTFDLVEITDFHGALTSSSTPPAPVAGVLAKDIRDVETANPTGTLVIGGGDLYQGTPVSNVLRGLPVQQAMSSIGMEVTALGNHEFDWGLKAITDTTMVGSKYAIVCANVYDKTTGKRVFEPYKIIEKNGVKIAIIGGITTQTPCIETPVNVANYRFTDNTTEINALVPEVRAKGATVVLAVIHEGSDPSDKSNASGPIFDIAGKLVGVDAVFGGHSHTIVAAKASNGIPVYIAKNAGKGYIDAKMTVGTDGKPSFICDASSYIAIDTDKPNGYKAATPSQDADVKTIVDAAAKQIGPKFDEVLGNTASDLKLNHTAPYESPLGDWAAEVTRSTEKADVGLVNAGGVRIDIPTGNITVGTVFTFMPFDDFLCTADMTKAQLKTILEQDLKDDGTGLEISGITVKYNPKSPSMNRVIDITRADGTPISDTEKLKVATIDFLATGGDGYKGFVDAGASVNGVLAHSDYINLRDALIQDVRDHKGITLPTGNHLVADSTTPAVTTTTQRIELNLTLNSTALKIRKNGTDSSATLSAAPVNPSGNTLVPVRGLYENLGAQVTWNDGNRTAIIQQGAQVITLTIGSDQLTVNGRSSKMPEAARIINGRLYLPLRAVAEQLGFQVNWNAANKQITVIQQ